MAVNNEDPRAEIYLNEKTLRFGDVELPLDRRFTSARTKKIGSEGKTLVCLTYESEKPAEQSHCSWYDGSGVRMAPVFDQPYNYPARFDAERIGLMVDVHLKDK